jgi:hypothetical protein
MLDMETIVLHVKGIDHDRGRRCQEIAIRVRDYFVSNLPVPAEARVLCYLDDHDNPWLKKQWGGDSNRGIHWPIRGQGLRDWPQDMWYTIAPVDQVSGNVTWPYDSVVYLHGSTCNVEVQLAMSLAHELQHFLQFAGQGQIWAINTLLGKLPYLPTADLSHWHDLPIEREARIIGKRVALNIFGESAVEEHIENMARLSSSPEDAANWDFIRALDSNEAYDIAIGTVPFVQRHRRGLEDLQRSDFAGDKDLGTVCLDI